MQLKIKEIKKINNNSKRYNIEVENNNNYFANNILVHNCQNMPQILNRNDLYYWVTSKLDGSSGTFFLLKTKTLGIFNKYTFGVCSRNIYLLQQDNSIYWKIARHYDIKKNLIKIMKRMGYSKKLIYIQGEIIGEGVQGNKYEIKGLDFYIFNLRIDDKKYDPMEQRIIFERADTPFKLVPVLHNGNFELLPSVPEMVEYAKGNSEINKNIKREGIVVRNYENDISFKVINPEFLLKYDD